MCPHACSPCSPTPCAGRCALPQAPVGPKDLVTITDASDTVWRKSFRETLVLGRLFFAEEALQRDLPGGERRKAGGRPARAGQRAVCRAGGNPGGLGGRHRLDLDAAAHDGFGEFEPATGARVDDVKQASLGRTRTLTDQAGDRLGQVAGGRGTPDLVRHHPERSASLGGGKDGLDEVLALPAVEPGGT